MEFMLHTEDQCKQLVGYEESHHKIQALREVCDYGSRALDRNEGPKCDTRKSERRLR